MQDSGYQGTLIIEAHQSGEVYDYKHPKYTYTSNETFDDTDNEVWALFETGDEYGLESINDFVWGFGTIATDVSITILDGYPEEYAWDTWDNCTILYVMFEIEDNGGHSGEELAFMSINDGANYIPHNGIIKFYAN